MDKQRTTVGIIGLGSFGQFLAAQLLPNTNLEILGYDSQGTTFPGVQRVSLQHVIRADIVILAIPFKAYPLVLPELAAHIRPDTLLIDICSVKVYPKQLMQKHLPDHPNLLLTHPLFGPQSAASGLAGHTLIVTDSCGSQAEKVLAHCSDTLKINIQRMDAASHDKVMGKIHVLTFFIARGLSDLQLDDMPFQTPSYSLITNLVAFDKSHTDELFKTIQEGNPFADDIRKEVIESFTALQEEINHGSPDAR